MDFFNEYKFLIVPLSTWFFIQIFKVISETIKNKKFDYKRILGAGGMPSSHSAVVTSLATLIGKSEGFNSSIFAISLIFACIVMYDATGVRRAAGKQARLLNKIVETPGLSGVQVQEKLVEVLGHTPLEVFVGALVGIFGSILLFNLLYLILTQLKK